MEKVKLVAGCFNNLELLWNSLLIEKENTINFCAGGRKVSVYLSLVDRGRKIRSITKERKNLIMKNVRVFLLTE